MIKVVIVEDDPMVAEFNKRYLEEVGGFELQAVATSVPEALDILRHKDVDLVLLDIFMPGQNGIELLEQIRKRGHGTDVIVVSAARETQTINKALQYGAVDYLIKPFEFQRFFDALSAYRERKSIIEEQDKLSQEELDKRIFQKDQAPPTMELPKGLNKDTLKLVWEKVQQTNGQRFTTEEIAQQVGITRVSMRKYLSFLNDIGVLETEATYGAIGRPVYKHRHIPTKNHLIKPYL